MKSLAVIGTGIAGMYSAYALRQRFQLTLYEKNDYVGGHTHTVEVAEGNRKVSIDTGFMVFNRATYPNLIRLFEELGVPIKPTSMSFSVQQREKGLEFCGSGWNGLFAQRRNLIRPRFWRLLSEINRFNQESVRLLENPGSEDLTVAAYAQQERFHRDFLDDYLIPMSSAVWSTPPDEMLRFPILTLIRFFKNHGFLGLNTQHPWLTVEGGSRVYRDKLIASYRDQIRLSSAAVRIERREGKVWVTDASGQSASYDFAIVASHADEALKILAHPTSEEQRLLSPFRYQTNIATLHTEEAVMPRTRACWSSWNYVTAKEGSSTVYWMNSLQGVSKTKNYFVSINDHWVPESQVLKRIAYTHPLFSVEAIQAQRELPTLNQNGPVYFCGSYFRYGFHEDALVSAMDVVQRLP